MRFGDDEKLEDILEVLKRLENKELKLMSTVTDWAAKEQVQLDAISATLDGVVAGVAALDAQIKALQNSPGTLSPSDQAALDAIETASAALVSKSKGIVVTPPVPPVA